MRTEFTVFKESQVTCFSDTVMNCGSFITTGTFWKILKQLIIKNDLLVKLSKDSVSYVGYRSKQWEEVNVGEIRKYLKGRNCHLCTVSLICKDWTSCKNVVCQFSYRNSWRNGYSVYFLVIRSIWRIYWSNRCVHPNSIY